MEVSVTVKHDTVADDGIRYTCTDVTAFLGDASALSERLQVSVWIPFQETITVAGIREAAIAKAQAEAEIFANIPRTEIEFVPELGTPY